MKRFARGRATLEMRLDEPVELLRELEERSPFEFRVRDRRFDRLVLDVDADTNSRGWAARGPECRVSLIYYKVNEAIAGESWRQRRLSSPRP